jgi:hypothetical protein
MSQDKNVEAVVDDILGTGPEDRITDADANDDTPATRDPDPATPDSQAPPATKGDDDDKGGAGADDTRMVPLSALHSERAKRRAEREQRLSLEQKIAELEARGSSPEADVAQPLDDTQVSRLEQLEAKQDGDYLTKAEVKEYLDLQRQRERHADQEQQQEATAAKAEVTVRAALELAAEDPDYSAQARGDGLSFEQVRDTGYVNLSLADKQAVMAAGANAAEKLYELCIARTPELQALQNETKTPTARRDGNPNHRTSPSTARSDDAEPDPPALKDVPAAASDILGDVFGPD